MSININQVTDTHTPTTGLETIVGQLLVTGGMRQQSSGAAATSGSVTISPGGSGATVVNTTAIKADSIVMLIPKNNISGANVPYVGTGGITAGTSFTITTDTLNTYQLYWVIIQQS